MSKHIRILVLSSIEGLEIAKAIQTNLIESGFSVSIWNQGGIQPGKPFLESILNEIDNCDFAISVLNSDDQIISRKQKKACPRDNVIFETGLGFAKLGFERTFYVFEKNSDIKIPTDLLGITGVEYSHPIDINDLQAELGSACTKIEHTILKIGPRHKSKHNIYDYKPDVDIYYYTKKLTQKNANNIAAELAKHKIDCKILQHDEFLEPDAVFIGSCVPAYYIRIVLKLLPYTIKYIFRPDYPDVDGGDSKGFKIGVGYSSKYNSESKNYRSKPVAVTSQQIKVLLDDNKSNTELHCYLFNLTMQNTPK